MTLGVGSWLVISTTHLNLQNMEDPAIHSAAVVCELTIAGTRADFHHAAPTVLPAPGTGAGPRTQMTLLGARTLAAPASAVVRCAAQDVEAESDAFVGAWLAIRVDSLTSL